MKVFKDRAYIPPVDKIRKDLGRFQERVDRKFILTTPKQTTANKPLLSNPTINKKGQGLGAYVILSIILVILFLFLILLISLFIGIEKNTVKEI